MVGIANEIAVENKLKVQTAAVYSEQNKDYLLGLRPDSRIRALDPAPHWTSRSFATPNTLSA